jgi:hypothetical protein
MGDPFNGEAGEPEISGACPLLTMHEGIFTCRDRRHPYYLKGCNVYPTHPDQIADKPGCSYKFQRIA